MILLRSRTTDRNTIQSQGNTLTANRAGMSNQNASHLQMHDTRYKLVAVEP